MERPKPKLHPMVAELEAAVVAVWEADAAWAADLDSPESKAAYKSARAAYKTLADKAEDMGLVDLCSRCGGPGGWEGWPGWTCFKCGGSGVSPYKRVKFQAMPPTREKNAAKARERAAAEEMERDANWRSFEEAHPAEAAFLSETYKTHAELDPDDDEGVGFDHFFSGLKEKARKFGSLSEKQVACITREMEKRAEVAAATPFPAGLHTVEGEIVSLPSTRGHGGGSKLNMLVKLSGEHVGNKVMGTIPEKVWAAMRDEDNQRMASLIGSRVRFTATLQQSDRDDHFGFFKGPKQVEVLYVNWSEEG